MALYFSTYDIGIGRQFVNHSHIKYLYIVTVGM